jgi:RNA polymerase sigma factor for flagellar operon FliA
MSLNSAREEIPRESWEEYIANPTPEFKNRVIEVYGYIPRTIAYQFARKKPHVLEMDDLIQAGNLGLVQAIDRYSPDNGAKFNTFATFRIRGSILDLINKVDWTPRPVRERIKKVIRVIESLNASAKDETLVTAEVLSQHIEDMTTEEVETVLKQLQKTYITHIDRDVLNAMESNNIGRGGESNTEHIKTVMNIVLDRKERFLIEMKFFGGYKDYEIMEKLGIKQHQLNQIEKRALEKLSHNLSDEDFF